MESAMSFSQLVADFKSKLENQNIPLKGQLIFSIGESPKVNVVFRPTPSSSSIEQGSKQNSHIIKDTSAICNVSSSFGIHGSDFDIQTCAFQNNDTQNKPFTQMSSKCAVEHVIVIMQADPSVEDEKINSEKENVHKSKIDFPLDSDDNKAISQANLAQDEVVEMTQSTFASVQKTSVKCNTIDNENPHFKKLDRQADLRVKDLNKLSHSELVSILSDILHSKSENGAQVLTDGIGKHQQKNKKLPDLNYGSKCLEMKKSNYEINILESNSNFVVDERDTKRIRGKGNFETEKKIQSTFNQRSSFQKDKEKCPYITQTMQEVNKIDSLDMTRQNGQANKKHSSQNKKNKKELKVLKYSCSVCSTTFDNKVFYKRHVCKDSAGFQCDICGKTLKSKDSLYHHQRGLHALKKQYSCQQCNIAFNFYHSYKLHIQRHKGQRPFQCQVCRKTYLTSNHLKVHVEATHKVRKKVCHVCGKKFSYSCSLKTHLQKHLGEKPFKCDVCNKRFTSNQTLKAHRLSHDPTKSYSCDICGNSYKSEHSKNVHMKHHSKQKRQFICELCGKTFHFKSTLTAHIDVHSKAKPYLCSQCGKGFKSKAALYTHKLAHKDPQSYVCTTCGKTFKTKNCCAAHMKRHSNQLTFSCDMCCSTFPDKGGLTKHMRTIHEPSKQYVCKICGKRGTRGDNMRTHVKNHNKEQNESTNPMDFIIEENFSEIHLGFNNVRPRIRGPKQRGSKNIPNKDILQTNEIKNEPQVNNLGSLDLSNQFKLQLGSLPTLQANLLTLPLMDSLQYNSHLSYITGDSFLQGDTHNFDDTSLVQVDQQISQEDGGLFQHDVNKTLMALMQTQSNDIISSDSLNMENLLSVINSEQDSSVLNSSILPQTCHEAVDLAERTSSQMQQLVVSCMYSDRDEGNITQLHEILNRENTLNGSSLL